MPVVIHGGGTIEGIAVGGLPDAIVDADMLASNAVTTTKIANSAVTAAKSTGLGISEVDQWRVHTDFAGWVSAAIVSSNWERVDTAPAAGKIGTGMAESSGIFTFPSIKGSTMVSNLAGCAVATTTQSSVLISLSRF